MLFLAVLAVFMIASAEAQCKNKPLELGIVLDSSMSILPKDFELAKEFLRDMANGFDIGPTQTRMSLILFGDKAYTDVSFDLDTYQSQDEIVKAINDITHQEGEVTDTYKGIDYMRMHQFSSGVIRPGLTKICIVITDGNSRKWKYTNDAAAAAVKDGIIMIAVGVGNKVDDYELNAIAGGNKSRVIHAAKFSELEKILKPLEEQICDPISTLPPSLAPTTSFPNSDSFAEECKEKPLELGIVLDSSSSIWSPDFDIAKEFLQDMVGKMDIGPTKTRVSLILFGYGIYKDGAFGLNTHTHRDDLVKAIGKIEHRYGNSTATGEGIDYMRDHQLASGIVRHGVTRVCVVITDGNSQLSEETKYAAAAAVKAGIIMIAIGVGDKVNDEELLNIAGGNSSRVIRASKFSDLEDVLNPLHKEICVPITTSAAPTKLPPTKAPTVLPKGILPAAGCGEANPADVYFVFSQSALGREDTVRTSAFVTRVVQSDQLKSGLRYGVISDSCVEGFDIGTFESVGPVVARMKDYEEYQLPALVKEIMHKGYPNHGRVSGTVKKTSKVAIVFSSRHQKGLAGTEEHFKALLADGVKVYLVDLSGQNVQISGITTLSGSPPTDLADEFVNKLCSL